jgi:CBS-domain-containing membrane protein
MKTINNIFVQLKITLLAGIGASGCITGLSFISSQANAIWLMAPFGATMVILFGLPSSPLAQPRNIILGHVITAAIGLIVAYFFGVNEMTLGLAVGLSVIAMMLTNTIHPPAGANPLVIMLAGESWSFLITPVATGALTIVCFGYLYHRTISRQQYPQKWF